jgi:hypothetical protein
MKIGQKSTAPRRRVAKTPEGRMDIGIRRLIKTSRAAARLIRVLQRRRATSWQLKRRQRQQHSNDGTTSRRAVPRLPPLPLAVQTTPTRCVR